MRIFCSKNSGGLFCTIFGLWNNKINRPFWKSRIQIIWYFKFLVFDNFFIGKSFTSRSYCCLPGGGYFENDFPVEPFNRYGIFTEFRDEDEENLFVDGNQEEKFFDNIDNWHLLDGFSEDGNPDSRPRKNTYIAYWTAIKNGFGSGLNQFKRRRRHADGRRLKRDIGKRRFVDFDFCGTCC